MAMAVPGRASVFTFESSVHPNHVLRSLEEQRQRDILCDVTVVTAEGQSFRAHRAVLASCSEYFSQRISSLAGQNPVITLPSEVTAAGFEPLLKFSYTSKLLFGKEDVLDIQTSASALGFKDLDGACFDFLLPKFFSSTKACVVRKTCCKKAFKKGLSRDTGDSGEHLYLDEKEEKPVADSPSQEEVIFKSNKSDTVKTLNTVCFSTPVSAVTKIPTDDNVIQCPKYRKFQIACGKESKKSQQKTVIKYCCDSPCSSNSESGSCPLRVSRQVEDLFDVRLGDFHHLNKADKTYEKKQEIGLMPPECAEEAQEDVRTMGQNRAAVNNNFAERGCVKAEEEITDKQDRDGKQKMVDNSNGKLSLEEAKTPNASLDWLNVQLNLSSSFPSNVDKSTSEWTCPKSSECEGTSQSGRSSLNSGEDSDTEDVDRFYDVYAQDRAKQVQLPYPLDQMLEMNKNDFQELLDKQNLTQEQLELVRDMRRRSKNRQAAQRCRKRKLDCIYNLQCEINKLKTEREKLIQEKSRLCQLRVKTCHSVFTLCQRVCAGADLPPDQLQLLDKNTFAECPLASYAPIIDSLLSSSQPQQSTQLPPSGAAEDVRFFSTESHFSGTKT
ncbi:hypothetical protein NQD34_010766 [Periophthalmus magnuspinnatus]|nr:hypothetical protein NQD34_010766 [Periophthalmus magnuspinnatus]